MLSISAAPSRFTDCFVISMYVVVVVIGVVTFVISASERHYVEENFYNSDVSDIALNIYPISRFVIVE